VPSTTTKQHTDYCDARLERRFKTPSSFVPAPTNRPHCPKRTRQSPIAIHLTYTADVEKQLENISHTTNQPKQRGKDGNLCVLPSRHATFCCCSSFSFLFRSSRKRSQARSPPAGSPCYTSVTPWSLPHELTLRRNGTFIFLLSFLVVTQTLLSKVTENQQSGN
jgi:hypothetical protein